MAWHVEIHPTKACDFIACVYEYERVFHRTGGTWLRWVRKADTPGAALYLVLNAYKRGDKADDSDVSSAINPHGLDIELVDIEPVKESEPEPEPERPYRKIPWDVF